MGELVAALCILDEVVEAAVQLEQLVCSKHLAVTRN